MKKYLFLLVAAAIALPLLVTSCKGNADTDSPEVVTFEPVKHAEEAIAVDITPTEAAEKAAEAANVDLPVYFENFGTGRGMAGFRKVTHAASRPAVTKADAGSEVYYISGTCTKNGNEYTLTGPDGVTYKFRITEKDGKQQIEFIQSGATLNLVGLAKAVKTTTDFATNLCRTWAVQKTRITIDGAASAFADFTGCNLNEIEAFAKKYFSFKESFAPNMVVKYVDISNKGTYSIAYQNGRTDVGEYSSMLSDGFTYQWKNPDMGFELENGKASFEFTTSNNVKYCIMTLKADIKDGGKTYNCVVYFTMTEVR